MKIPQSQQKRFDALQPTRNPASLEHLFAQFPLNGTKITEDWKALLAQDTYQVMFHKGTEPAFHNAYFDHHASGRYHCKACG
ncbi:MAG: peptide-methionine (R)-S-oxide reductase, partial [Erysipelotrichaceae bacterium]